MSGRKDGGLMSSSSSSSSSLPLPVFSKGRGGGVEQVDEGGGGGGGCGSVLHTWSGGGPALGPPLSTFTIWPPGPPVANWLRNTALLSSRWAAAADGVGSLVDGSSSADDNSCLRLNLMSSDTLGFLSAWGGGCRGRVRPYKGICASDFLTHEIWACMCRVREPDSRNCRPHC